MADSKIGYSLQQPRQQHHSKLESTDNSRKRTASEVAAEEHPYIRSDYNALSGAPFLSMGFVGDIHSQPYTAPSKLAAMTSDVSDEAAYWQLTEDLPSFQTQDTMSNPLPKQKRTNTPWTPAEEQRLKTLRDAGRSWSDISKTFPLRTEGSVKKHWYKVCENRSLA